MTLPGYVHQSAYNYTIIHFNSKGALGLKALRGSLAGLSEAHRAALIGRYRLPQPRVTCGPRLVGLAHASIDVSDGLVADLGHVADVSGVAAIVEAAAVPLSTAGAAALESDPALRLFSLVSSK